MKIVGSTIKRKIMEKDFILFKNEGLEERFTSAKSKKQHFYSHIGKTSANQAEIDAYEAAADALALKPVDHKTIFGYEVDPNSYASHTPHTMRARRFCKYNKATEEYVVYGGFSLEGEPIVISFYHISWREFQAKMYTNYLDEIPVPEFQKYWDFSSNPKAELVKI